jgi:hypothetical protein
MKKPATNKKLEEKILPQPEHSKPQTLEEIAATIERGRAMMIKAFYQGVSNRKKEKPQ